MWVQRIPTVPVTAGARRTAPLALALALTLSVASCGRSIPAASEPTPSQDDQPAVSPPGRTDALPATPDGITAAWATRDVAVWSRPGGGKLVRVFPAKQPWGDPIAFLVRRQVHHDGVVWHQVLVPHRPNGSTGWVKDGQVRVVPLAYRVEVDLSRRELRVLKGDRVERRFPVAIGAEGTPTPTGDFYLTAKLRPPRISPVFGSWALALSAWSEVLDQFGTGDGQIALHGTRSLATLGKAVSHGCVRLDDRAIIELAELLPLGSPVTISA
jgi:lipoprotein-anchoring transpeptidase ErfK/SrfK